MAKIVIWFYVGVFFLEMNLMATGSLVNPNWPVRGFGSVQLFAGTVVVDFLGLLSLTAWLLTPKKPTPPEPIDFRKTFEYWKPSYFINGPYPDTAALAAWAFFAGATAFWAALCVAAFTVWRDAPLPEALRITLRANSLLCATGLMLFCAWVSEGFLVMLFIRRLRWRGPPMNREEFARWKAANPGAPMPWERGRRGSAAKEKDVTGKREMPGDER
jgi:hypothetical protein